jgi:hypothetical protein
MGQGWEFWSISPRALRYARSVPSALGWPRRACWSRSWAIPVALETGSMGIPGAIPLRGELKCVQETSPNEYCCSRTAEHRRLSRSLLPATWLFLWGASHTPWPWPFAFALGFSHLHMTLIFTIARGRPRRFLELAPRGTNAVFGRLSAVDFSPHPSPSSGSPTWGTTGATAPMGTSMTTSCPPNPRRAGPSWLYAGNLFGFYYWCLPLGLVVYFLTPGLFTSSWFPRRDRPAFWDLKHT